MKILNKIRGNGHIIKKELLVSLKLVWQVYADISLTSFLNKSSDMQNLTWGKLSSNLDTGLTSNDNYLSKTGSERLK